MVYRFAQERQDHRDLAAGAVLQGLPGHPAFPIRLTSEIFQRCLDIRVRDGQIGTCSVYDPCCGSGYLLTTLALLHWREVKAIYASDADERVLEVAARNLNLLNLEGLQQRINQIEDMIRQYNKPSHKEALESAERIRARLRELQARHSISVQTFQANIATANLADHLAAPVDVVVTDVPYGRHSSWIGVPDTSHEPTWYLLQALLPILSRHSVVAIVADKQQKVTYEQYRRIEHFQIGKRRIVILKAL